MTKELLALLVIGGGMYVLVQYTGLKVWHALVVLAGGYYLATSALGPQVGHVLSKISGLFGLHL